MEINKFIITISTTTVAMTKVNHSPTLKPPVSQSPIAIKKERAKLWKGQSALSRFINITSIANNAYSNKIMKALMSIRHSMIMENKYLVVAKARN